MTDFDELIGAGDGFLAEGVAVTHDGHQIKAISRTCVALWNHMGDVVGKSDVLATDPVGVRLPAGDRALQARIIARSREQNAVSVTISEEDPRFVLIEFDFLDANDGAIVEVIHQGGGQGELVGTIRGASLVDFGGADLSLTSLVEIAASGILGRFLRRYTSHPKALVLLGFSIGTMLAPFIFLAYLMTYRDPFREGSLVSPRGYDLNTLDGQIEFAQKVREIGPPNLTEQLSSATIFLLGVGSLVVMSNTLLRPLRSVIPRGVLREFIPPTGMTIREKVD
ncbi:hypothetical protein [Micromonospora wenchangensis]|uniref:hypothetical protein n=1 Tax=Micromonospora wenchangensis TaxID=1185415 RepID=UPI003425AAC0